MSYFFTDYGLDYIRAGYIHIATAFNHENPIGKGRGVNSASGCRSHNGRYLRNITGSNGIAVENSAIAFKRRNPFLNARTTGIIHRHKRLLRGDGHVHHFPYFLGVHFSKTSAGTGEILSRRTVSYTHLRAHETVLDL